MLTTLYRQNFVVYAKPPFGGVQQVYRYLGRYTDPVAISNARLASLQDGLVRFRYKDYAHGSQIKEMTLSAEEFLRRFLLHVLPKGFVRIRHYGLLAGRNVTTRLERSRQLLGCPHEPAPSAESKTWAQPLQEWTGQDYASCPHCGVALDRQPLAAQRVFRPATLPSHAVPILDSS